MTCGIYKLTFSNGQFYIGKSINIEKRWLQHFDKMQKGTAAALVQQQYNRHGLPKAEIIYECNEDHIDIVEESVICRLQPPLNSTFTRDRLKTSNQTLNDIDLYPFLQSSTLEHLSEIVKLRSNVDNLCNTINTLVNIGETLAEKRNQEELNHDTSKRIRVLQEQVLHKALEVESAKSAAEALKRALDYEKLSWWQKLFM